MSTPPKLDWAVVLALATAERWSASAISRRYPVSESAARRQASNRGIELFKEPPAGKPPHSRLIDWDPIMLVVAQEQLGASEAAARFSVCDSSVRQEAEKRGIELPDKSGRARTAAWDWSAILSPLHAEGLTVLEMAEKLGVRDVTVYRQLRDLGLEPLRKGGPKDIDWPAILKEANACDLSSGEVAAEVGCSRSAVKRAARILGVNLRQQPRQVGDCDFPGCGRAKKARGWCEAHRQQTRKHGDQWQVVNRFAPSEIVDVGEHLEVVLMGFRGVTTGRVKIDKLDESLARDHRWNRGAGYACRSMVDDSTERLYRIIARNMGIDDALEVDFINGDILDCRRANLRSATRKQQCENVPVQDCTLSGHRNVYPRRNERGKITGWWASVSSAGQKFVGPTRETIEEAHEDAVAIRARVFTHHNEDRAVDPVLKQRAKK